MPIKPALTLGRPGTILCSHRFLSVECLPPLPRFPPSFIKQETSFAKPYHLRLLFVSRAAESSRPASAVAADKAIVPDDEFSLAKACFRSGLSTL